MYHIDDPAQMTPEERLTEVAAILAKGFLRWKRRASHIEEPDSEESGPLIEKVLDY